MAKFAILLVASLCATLCAAIELGNVVKENELPPFEETSLGYDKHNDYYYFADDVVRKEYARSKYADTKVSLGGQGTDSTGRNVDPSIYPFIVGQKSKSKLGSNADRWDVKAWDKKYDTGIEFFGLYHGNDNEFLVNKLRANLLRNVANALKNVLPVLDSNHPPTEANSGLVGLVRDEITRIIVEVFKQMDESIRSVMKDNDDTSATASIVIVTKKFLITAHVGNGKIIAQDSLGNAQELSTDGLDDPSNPANMNLFGLRKSKAGPCIPSVGIFEREFEVKVEADEDEDEDEMIIPGKYQFVVIETPSVATLLPTDEATKIVRSQVNQHKADEAYEQEMYTGAVVRMLKEATKDIGLFSMFKHTDHAVMVIGLEKDYKNIH